jgi:hypothetical protein
MPDTEFTARLERLERDNRRLKRGGLLLLAMLVALIVIYATRPVPDRITAHEFDLVDATGTTRASLGLTAYEPRLWLQGFEDKITISTLTFPRIALSSNKGVVEFYVQPPGEPFLLLDNGDNDHTHISATGLNLRKGDNNRLIDANTR